MEGAEKGGALTEGPIMTWASIAKFCGFSVRTARRLKERMLGEGVVFVRRRRCGSNVFCAWPEDLKRFCKK